MYLLVLGRHNYGVKAVFFPFICPRAFVLLNPELFTHSHMEQSSENECFRLEKKKTFTETFLGRKLHQQREFFGRTQDSDLTFVF